MMSANEYIESFDRKFIDVAHNAYKRELAKYTYATVNMVDKHMGKLYESTTVDFSNYINQDFIKAHLPLYYVMVANELAQRDYNNVLNVYTGQKLGDEVAKSMNRNEGLIVLMSLTIRNHTRYLCTFRQYLDENFDNNSFFVWEKDINNDEFNTLNRQKIYDMSKQTTLASGLDMLFL